MNLQICMYINLYAYRKLNLIEIIGNHILLNLNTKRFSINHSQTYNFVMFCKDTLIDSILVMSISMIDLHYIKRIYMY